MNMKAGIPLGATCLVLGLLLSMQFKSVARDNETRQTQGERIETLQQMLGEEKERAKAQEGLLQQYKEEIDRFRSELVASEGMTDSLLKKMKEAELLAGLTDVTGPGVTITLADSQAPAAEGAVEETYIIHDSDLLMLINELRGSGAEAISLNDLRLVATSEIRCAGAVVSINNTRTSAPFVIRAIGSPQTMYNALNMRGGVVDILSRWGINISVQMEEQLAISRFDGVITYGFAASEEG